MNETKKNVQAQGAETINFANGEEKMNGEVEQLRKELEQAKKDAKQYKDWWLSETKKADEQIKDLRTALDKVAAVAGMYLDTKVWNK